MSRTCWDWLKTTTGTGRTHAAPVWIHDSSRSQMCILSYVYVAELTVTVVAGVDVSLQCFGLCELGQHFCQVARSLSSRLPAITVIALGELQRQIPEWFHGVGAMVTGQTRNLHTRTPPWAWGMKLPYFTVFPSFTSKLHMDIFNLHIFTDQRMLIQS